MRSRFVLAATALLLLGGALPASAASPIGVFDGKPGGGNAAWGQLQLVGWALDDNGVASVDIVIDDNVYQRALYGSRRPDVTRRKPGFPNSTAPGFSATVDTTHFLNGVHDGLGAGHQPRRRAGGHRPGEADQLPQRQPHAGALRPHHLPAAGRRDARPLQPRPDAPALHRHRRRPRRRLAARTPTTSASPGWSCCSTAALTLNTQTSCHFDPDPSVNMLLNCYGLASRELTFVYPHLPELRPRQVAVRARRRRADQLRLLHPRPPHAHHPRRRLRRQRPQHRHDQRLLLLRRRGRRRALDRQAGGAELHPALVRHHQRQGWAVDFQGIASIDIKVNGFSVGQATLGGPRPDVAELYPGYPSVKSAGWTFNFDSRTVNDGHVTFEVWVRDLVGDETLIGEGVAVIDNRDHP